MARVIVELSEDIRFEDGTWVPTDVRTEQLVEGVRACCGTPRRLFSRPAATLDVERVALSDLARRSGEDAQLPDLNLYYIVEGEIATLLELPLVHTVTEVVPLPPPAPMEGAVGRRLELAGDALLADAIDRGAAELGPGDALLVPYPLGDPASRAAAELAARKGIRVVTPEGAVAGGKRAPAPRRSRVRAQVTLDRITLVAGGDRGDSEIYVEGWIDDGVRRRLRVPERGAVTGVRHGVPQPFDAPLYDGIPLGDALIVHLEVWEEDLGRESLIDPDDLLGVHEGRYGAGNRWGEGRHEDVRVETEDGVCLVTYTIRTSPAGS